MGLLKLDFKIGDKPFVTNMRVMRGLVRPVVLGWDFLCNNKAILNLRDNTLTFENVVVPFQEIVLLVMLLREKVLQSIGLIVKMLL